MYRQMESAKNTGWISAVAEPNLSQRRESVNIQAPMRESTDSPAAEQPQGGNNMPVHTPAPRPMQTMPPPPATSQPEVAGNISAPVPVPMPARPTPTPPAASQPEAGNNMPTPAPIPMPTRPTPLPTPPTQEAQPSIPNTEGCGFCVTLAMSYVPMQQWRKLYEPEDSFGRGTIFEELDLPFMGKGNCRRD